MVKVWILILVNCLRAVLSLWIPALISDIWEQKEKHVQNFITFTEYVAMFINLILITCLHFGSIWSFTLVVCSKTYKLNMVCTLMLILTWSKQRITRSILCWPFEAMQQGKCSVFKVFWWASLSVYFFKYICLCFKWFVAYLCVYYNFNISFCIHRAGLCRLKLSSCGC